MILETRALSRTFGAVVAVDAVDLGVAAGHVHAVIGPNGAGKTTLLNLLSGELAPSAGRIVFNGREMAGLTPDRVARAGIGRTFQRVNVFPHLSCLRSCWLGARAAVDTRMRFVRPAAFDRGSHDTAMAALAAVGLTRRADTPAGALSHGEQRQLELAMVLAAAPALLLLDEPLAGLGREESGRMAALIRGLAPRHTVVLVEHDMDAVFAIADVITVMDGGRVLESGPPDAIRASTAVRDAYLGAVGMGAVALP